jgi:hypothetical protein
MIISDELKSVIQFYKRSIGIISRNYPALTRTLFFNIVHEDLSKNNIFYDQAIDDCIFAASINIDDKKIETSCNTFFHNLPTEDLLLLNTERAQSLYHILLCHMPLVRFSFARMKNGKFEPVDLIDLSEAIRLNQVPEHILGADVFFRTLADGLNLKLIICSMAMCIERFPRRPNKTYELFKSKRPQINNILAKTKLPSYSQQGKIKPYIAQQVLAIHNLLTK